MVIKYRFAINFHKTMYRSGGDTHEKKGHDKMVFIIRIPAPISPKILEACEETAYSLWLLATD